MEPFIRDIRRTQYEGLLLITAAKGLNIRLPAALVWQKAFTDKHEAMHWEARIKKWPRSKKARLLSPTGRQLELAMDQTDNKAHT